MFVGTLRLVLHIPHAQTLKDRRRVVLKLKDRLRARLRVSVCELGEADRHQVAILGIATVGRDRKSCRAVLESAKAMAETLGDSWLTDANGEVWAFGEAGGNLRGGIEAFQLGGIWEEGKSPPSGHNSRPSARSLDSHPIADQSAPSAHDVQHAGGLARLKRRIQKR